MKSLDRVLALLAFSLLFTNASAQASDLTIEGVAQNGSGGNLATEFPATGSWVSSASSKQMQFVTKILAQAYVGFAFTKIPAAGIAGNTLSFDIVSSSPTLSAGGYNNVILALSNGDNFSYPIKTPMPSLGNGTYGETVSVDFGTFKSGVICLAAIIDQNGQNGQITTTFSNIKYGKKLVPVDVNTVLKTPPCI